MIRIPVKKAWRQYLLLFCVLISCAVLASAAALLFMERRHEEETAAETLATLNRWMGEYAAILEKNTENALLINAYALEKDLLWHEQNAGMLDRYTVYRTLRSAAVLSDYLYLISLYNANTGLVYDSLGNTASIETNPDAGLEALIRENAALPLPSLEKLAYHDRILYQKAPYESWTHTLSAVLTRKDGTCLVVNIDLDRFYRDLQAALRETVSADLVLRAGALTLSGVSETQTAAMLAAVPDGTTRYLPGEEIYINAVQSGNFGLRLTVAVPRTAILARSEAALRRMQGIQLGFFAVTLAIFTVLLLFFFRPITRILKNISMPTPARCRQPGPSIFNVNEMLQMVVDQNRSLGEFRSQALPVYRSNLLVCLLLEKGDKTKTLEELARYDIHFKDGGWYSAALELSDDDDESMLLSKLLIVRRGGELIPPQCGFAVSLGERRIGVAFHSQDGAPGFAAFLDRLRESVLLPVKSTVTIAAGRLAQSIHHLHASWNEAAEALEYRILFAPGEIIYADRFKPQRGVLTRQYDRSQAALLECVRAGDGAQAERIVASLLDFMQEKRYHISVEEALDVSITLLQSVTAEEPLPGVSQSFYGLYRRISGAGREALWAILRGVVAEASCRAMTDRDEGGENRTVRAVHSACEYIDENFVRDLSLDTLAEYVGLNTSYLSSIFKKTLGISFTQYLKKRRIEEGARLIREKRLTITQIAEAVGYHSRNYFSKEFRTVIGVTPESYRQNLP